MTYPPRPDPHGQQPGGYPSGPYQQPQQGFQYPQAGSEQFWRQVAGGAPPPPPPQQRTSRVGLIIGLALGALVFLALGAFAIVVAVSAASEIEAGDCMSLRDDRGGEMVSADCGSAESDYEVVDVKPGRSLAGCGDDYVNFTDGDTYCIVLDVKVGDCLTAFQQDQEVLPLKIECAQAQDQVTGVVSGQDPETACGANEGYYVFTRKTVCFGDVQGI